MKYLSVPRWRYLLFPVWLLMFLPAAAVSFLSIGSIRALRAWGELGDYVHYFDEDDGPW